MKKVDQVIDLTPVVIGQTVETLHMERHNTVREDLTNDVRIRDFQRITADEAERGNAKDFCYGGYFGLGEVTFTQFYFIYGRPGLIPKPGCKFIL